MVDAPAMLSSHRASGAEKVEIHMGGFLECGYPRTPEWMVSNGKSCKNG